MNEEEKRTVNFVKKYLNDDMEIYHITKEDIIILVNLIDKQQREIDVKELQLHLQREEMNSSANKKEFNYEKWVAKMKELEKIEKQINGEVDKLSKQCSNELYSFEGMQIDENIRMVTGYYHILEYCLQQIKNKDKNLLKGFVGVNENE